MTEVMQAVSHSSPQSDHYPRSDPRRTFLPLNSNPPSSSTSTIRPYTDNPSNSSNHSTPIREKEYKGTMATDQQPPQSAANPESPSSRSYGQPVRPAGLDQTTRPASSQLPAESDYASRQYAAQNPAPVPPPRTSSTHKHSPSMPARASSHSRPDGAGKQTTVASNDRVRSSPRFDSGASLQPEHTPKRPRGAEPSQATPPTKKSRDQNPVDNQPDGASNSRGEDLVIKRIVITDPEVDRARMEERAAQSVPSSQHQDAQRSHAGGLAVVGSEGVDDAARVHRQTNGQATSSRRREIRFGDYILGATLGEGEFGKVKMGWKTHGGVQVGYLRPFVPRSCS